MTNILVDRRQELMGIAIISVLLYHLCCWPTWNYSLSIFGYGYIGVDVFLLLSGFGLCFSLNKVSSIKEFYVRRCLRIFPLYWFSVLVGSILDWKGAWVLICRLTTLNYYGVVNDVPNWYVSGLFFLYMIFPFLYIILDRYPKLTFLICLLFSFIVQEYITLEWYHDCLISRLPIFFYGIVCYFTYVKQKSLIPFLLMTTIFWIYAISYTSSRFFITSTFCPLLLSAMLPVLGNKYIYSKSVNNIIKVLGRYSFEIFLSNGFTYSFVNYLNNVGFLRSHYYIKLILVYFLVSIIFGFFMCKVSKWLKVLCE